MSADAPSVTVHVSSVLLAYTGQRAEIAAAGATVAAALDDLDRRFAGVKWRVVDEQGRLRPHMALFVDGKPTRDLAARLRPGATVHLLHALSGG